ncbi:unnamed protein product [Closterium sp. Yama58-4]|nr:unnamed protein product [Closterium sp. Yama58-4]CAI5475882.1 unnamed protein product [Closterium sp. Yama58-4]CAI5475883.1 unnamed protein product [Closterium sp. Yama58-4]CAI5475884.1 unnamed protein product [Closterium sp. Yama58-4]CAI5475885.1 unnamed protein product [Closterium sp. Yama58-4]
MARVSKVASLLCVGIVLLALALTPADAIPATSSDLNSDGTCYRDFQGRFRNSPYFGKVAQVPVSKFNSNKGCGTCYEVSCSGRACKGGSVKVRAIGNSGWEAFNLDAPVWNQLVGGQGGQVEVTYDPVDCDSSGGMAVRLLGQASRDYFALQILGTAKKGGVDKVELSSDGKKWSSMFIEGGAWVMRPATGVVESGRAVSVRVTAADGGRQVVLDRVIPSNWSGREETYKTNKNF